jgi:hypothetical protein
MRRTLSLTKHYHRSSASWLTSRSPTPQKYCLPEPKKPKPDLFKVQEVHSCFHGGTDFVLLFLVPLRSMYLRQTYLLRKHTEHLKRKGTNRVPGLVEREAPYTTSWYLVLPCRMLRGNSLE